MASYKFLQFSYKNDRTITNSYKKGLSENGKSFKCLCNFFNVNAEDNNLFERLVHTVSFN